MSKFTYEMVQRFIDQGMNSITIKWSKVDPAWKILIHERIINAGYVLEIDNLQRKYTICRK